MGWAHHGRFHVRTNFGKRNNFRTFTLRFRLAPLNDSFLVSSPSGAGGDTLEYREWTVTRRRSGGWKTFQHSN